MWAFVIIAVAGIALWLLAELVLPLLFSYIGARAIWLVTFGRVRMEPLDGGESELASQIGFGLVFIIILVGYTIFRFI